MATRAVDRGEIERAMRRTPLLSQTPTAAVRDLAAAGSVREYERGTYLFHQGDRPGDVFFLWRGRIEIRSTSVAGQRQLHATLEPPEFFGEFAVLGEMPRTGTAVAVEDCAVVAIEGPTFLRFLEGDPGTSRAMLRALARQIQAHEALVEDLLFLDLKGRVAKRLLGLVAGRSGVPVDDGAVVPSWVTHAHLASLSGGSRENVTRILSELQRRGVVGKNGRRYVLRDVDRLRRLARL